MQERASSPPARQGAQAQRLVVLGGGLAGLSAAFHARSRQTTVLERADRVGGHAVSRREAGHTFDVTGHWLHLRRPETLTWIRRLDPNVEWMEISRSAQVYCEDRHLPYPFQLNLHGLSAASRQRCVDTLPDEIPVPSQAQDFEAYVLERFGRGMTELFFRPYNEKLWGCPLSALRPDAMSRFLPQPELGAIRAGALAPLDGATGYNAVFHYPRAGGIDHLPNALARAIARDSSKALHCGHTVHTVDLRRKEVHTRSAQGEPHSWGFDRLVSTMPLPVLLEAISDVPPDIAQAAGNLRWSSWRYLDLALSKPPPRRVHWIYVPDRDIRFFRVGCSTFACPAMAPPGQASVCVELADRHGPLDLDAILTDLVRVGMLGDRADLKFVRERRVSFAYVHFDANYRNTRDLALRWLAQQGVQSVGRYGGWGYGSMEDSLDAGRVAAMEVL